MSNYPAPPPQYQSGKSYSATDESTQPLLHGHGSYTGPSSSRPAVATSFVEPIEVPSDIPEDFKYGVCVADSAPEIRNAFIRKIYSILFCQILATCIVGGTISQSPSAIFWVQTHIWSFYLPMFGTIINLLLLYWKRHSVPANYILLSTFTLFEAFTLGVSMSFVKNTIILQALLITCGVFIGLTIFTYQSKYDFSGLGPWLFGGLIALVMAGVVGLLIPFSRTMDIIFAIGGCLIFSGYVVYDTYLITNRLSPDEYIAGAISLYLDFLNLFINILRLLNDIEDR